ncbi:hypothetical protein Tco_1048696 [Tanacetum coccineum]
MKAISLLRLAIGSSRVEMMEQQVLNPVVKMMLVIVNEEQVLGKIDDESLVFDEHLVVDMIDDEQVLHKTAVVKEYGGVTYELETKARGLGNLSLIICTSLT